MSVYHEAVQRSGGLCESHQRMLRMIEPGTVVLEVGCSTGYFTEAAYRRGVKAVDCVELDPHDARSAMHACRNMTVGSIEDRDVLATLPVGAYDVIVLGDVVEHLRDPGRIIGLLRRNLAPGGCLIVSTPNIAHVSMRLGLLRGRFEYQDTGILDRTHSYLFTRRSLTAALRANGLEIVREQYTYKPSLIGRLLESLAWPVGPMIGRIARRATKRWPELLAYQFVVMAKQIA